jgi:hypothetical protein
VVVEALFRFFASPPAGIVFQESQAQRLPTHRLYAVALFLGTKGRNYGNPLRSPVRACACHRNSDPRDVRARKVQRTELLEQVSKRG